VDLRRALSVLLGLGLLLLWPAILPAQQQEEDETEEQRRRDEAYLERYRQQQDRQSPQTDRADQPDDDPAEVARSYAARADELIRDKNHHSIELEHYRVQTDDPRLDVEATAELLEALRGFFDQTWESSPSESRDGPVRVFLFYSYHKYNQLIGGDWSRQLLRPKGHYGSTLDALVVHTDSDRAGGLPNTLIHEATHQLVDAVLYQSNGGAATWITEGLATYYQNTLMDRDGFHSGVVGPKSVTLMRGDGGRPTTDAGTQLRLAKQALRHAASAETPLSVVVVSADQAGEFYGDNIETMYATSWILVHFLLHGEQGRHADAFSRFIAIDAEGVGTPRRFFAELALDGAELDEALRRHAKTIKVR